MPAIIPFITGIGATAGAATLPSMLAAAAPAVGTIATGASIYDSLVAKPQQAQQQISANREALSKQNMSEFLKSQITKNAANGQFGAQMPQDISFLKNFLNLKLPESTGIDFNQGGYYG